MLDKVYFIIYDVIGFNINLTVWTEDKKGILLVILINPPIKFQGINQMLKTTLIIMSILRIEINFINLNLHLLSIIAIVLFNYLVLVIVTLLYQLKRSNNIDTISFNIDPKKWTNLKEKEIELRLQTICNRDIIIFDVKVYKVNLIFQKAGINQYQVMWEMKNWKKFQIYGLLILIKLIWK